jgi:hypothetical protein
LNITNAQITHFSNSYGTVRLTQLANAFMVSVEPRYGDNIVNSFSDLKLAQRDYSYFVHYFTQN